MDKYSSLDLRCHAKQELRPLKNEDLHELTRKPYIKYRFILKNSFTGKACSSTHYPSFLWELPIERDSLEFWDSYSYNIYESGTSEQPGEWTILAAQLYSPDFFLVDTAGEFFN